jgi:hypothetical protein
MVQTLPHLLLVLKAGQVVVVGLVQQAGRGVLLHRVLAQLKTAVGLGVLQQQRRLAAALVAVRRVVG